jgi:hypothetical protein
VILILNNRLSGRAVFVFYSPAGKTYERVTWSTPVSDYKDINGFNLATYGEAVWGFPEETFVMQGLI